MLNKQQPTLFFSLFLWSGPSWNYGIACESVCPAQTTQHFSPMQFGNLGISSLATSLTARDLKKKRQNVNIASTIDITLAFRTHWDNVLPVGEGVKVSCAGQ